MKPRELRIALDYKRTMVEVAMRRGMPEDEAVRFAQKQLELQLGKVDTPKAKAQGVGTPGGTQ